MSLNDIYLLVPQNIRSRYRNASKEINAIFDYNLSQLDFHTLNSVLNLSDGVDLDIRSLILIAAHTGKAEALDWVRDMCIKQSRKFDCPNLVIQELTAHNHLHLLDWFLENVGVAIFEQFELDYSAYQVRILECVKWFYSKRDLIKINYTCKLIDNVVWYPHGLDFVIWCTEHEDFEFKYSYKAIDSISRGSLDVLKWWYDKYTAGLLKFEYSIDAFKNAAFMGDANIVRWWIDHDDEFELIYDDAIFYTSDIIVLQILSECPSIIITVDEQLINFLASTTLIDTLDWWYAHRHAYGFPVRRDIIDEICQEDNPVMLRWWLEHFNDIPDLEYSTSCVDHGSVGILDLWFEFRDSVEMKYTIRSTELLQPAIIEWWLSKPLLIKYDIDQIMKNHPRGINSTTQGLLDRLERLIKN